MENTKFVMDLLIRIGESLLSNGAEISRVQETVERVAKAFSVENVNVYVLTNAIFVDCKENGLSCTKLKHIPSASIHVGRISAINQLSREIESGAHTIETASQKLEEIGRSPYSRLSLVTLACGVGSACSSILFGGNLWDACNAFLCGLILELFLYWAAQKKLSKFLINLLSGAVMAFCATVIFTLGLGSEIDKIIIGSIIRLVPGVALTNSIRDFINGDYLSGTIRMIDAFLIGACIGVGVGVIVTLKERWFGGFPL